jgi:transposase
VEPPAPEIQELRALLRHLDDLQAMLQQERNRLQAGEQSPTVLTQLQQHVAFLEVQIAPLKQQINDHFDQHPHLKQQRDLLTSIPGIGDLTVGRLLAELRDIQAFSSARQVAAFVGVTPRQVQSGTSCHRRRRLSKRGTAALRAALDMPAVVAKRWNPLIRGLAERLRARRHTELSIIGAAMHKLLHLTYGVLKSGQPFDPLYRTNGAGLETELSDGEVNHAFIVRL